MILNLPCFVRRGKRLGQHCLTEREESRCYAHLERQSTEVDNFTPLAQGQPFQTSLVNEGCGQDTFIMLRLSSSLILKGLFSDGLVLRGWQKSCESLCLLEVLQRLAEKVSEPYVRCRPWHCVVQNLFPTLRVYSGSYQLVTCFLPPPQLKNRIRK